MNIFFQWDYEGSPWDIEGQILPGHTPVNVDAPAKYESPHKWWTTANVKPGQYLRIRVHEVNEPWSNWSDALLVPAPRTVPEPDGLLIGVIFVLCLWAKKKK